jgi:hypothetical protein
MNRMIKRTLYISNKHISTKDENILAKYYNLNNQYIQIERVVEGGFLISINTNTPIVIENLKIDQEINGLSDGFLKCLQLGYTEQVEYIKIVCYGPVYSDLDLFEKD